MKENAQEIGSLIYEQRVLVFIEIEPQSNQFRQVLLDNEQFKKVTTLFGTLLKTDEKGLEHYEMKESDEIYNLPDLQSYL